MAVKFDPGKKQATVTYDPAIADSDAIRDAIDRANDLMRGDDNQADDAGQVLE